MRNGQNSSGASAATMVVNSTRNDDSSAKPAPGPMYASAGCAELTSSTSAAATTAAARRAGCRVVTYARGQGDRVCRPAPSRYARRTRPPCRRAVSSDRSGATRPVVGRREVDFDQPLARDGLPRPLPNGRARGDDGADADQPGLVHQTRHVDAESAPVCPSIQNRHGAAHLEQPAFERIGNRRLARTGRPVRRMVSGGCPKRPARSSEVTCDERRACIAANVSSSQLSRRNPGALDRSRSSRRPPCCC